MILKLNKLSLFNVNILTCISLDKNGLYLNYFYLNKLTRNGNETNGHIVIIQT